MYRRTQVEQLSHRGRPWYAPYLLVRIGLSLSDLRRRRVEKIVRKPRWKVVLLLGYVLSFTCQIRNTAKERESEHAPWVNFEVGDLKQALRAS